MADVKRAIRGLPPRGANEPPATERQKGFVRSFGYFTERLIQSLGIEQASYLINEAIAIRDQGRYDDRWYRVPRKHYGCGSLILIIVVIATVTGIASHFLSSNSSSPSDLTESESKPAAKERREKPTPSMKSHVNGHGVSENQFAPAVVQPIETPSLNFEIMEFPVVVVTNDKVDLLNQEGKETPIGVGTSIKIMKRTPAGTLTMEIDGKLFFGNEARFLKKIRMP
jgi:hypothetical protein